MTAPSCVTFGWFLCAISSHSGSGSPAMPDIKSTGAVKFSFWKMARSVWRKRLRRSWSARLTRLSRLRTKFQLIGKDVLPAPLCQLTIGLFDVTGDAMGCSLSMLHSLVCILFPTLKLLLLRVAFRFDALILLLPFLWFQSVIGFRDDPFPFQTVLLV